MKKKETLFRALSDVQDEYIEEAGTTKLRKQSGGWKKWTALAACGALVIGLGGSYLLQNMGGNTGGNGGPHDDTSEYMSYGGPAFPLTLSAPDEAISATRNIAYDFSLPTEDSIRVWGATVTDSYALFNSSEEEKAVTVRYPFVGSFQDLNKQMPTITVDGQKVSPTLHAGAFRGDGIEDFDPSPNPKSWEGYKALLADGSYIYNAFSKNPTLSQRVTVYTFTDFELPAKVDSGRLTIFYNIDPTKTTVFTYGFDGVRIDEDGTYRVGDVSQPEQAKLLVVLGDDIGEYSYKIGNSDDGKELDGASATVTQTEEVFSDVMGELVTDYFAQYGDGAALTISHEMFLDNVSQFLCQSGLASTPNEDLFQYTWLEDVFAHTQVMERVFYLDFDVTIPAGEDASVAAQLYKEPSFDFGGSGSKNEGIQGYDMVTQLESNLSFDQITAELTSTDHIKIVRQNFGFDLKNNISKVELDPDTEHYYLDISTVET